MKFNFWFDLPEALKNIMENILTPEEVEYSNILHNSYKIFTGNLNTVNEILTSNFQRLSSEEMHKVTQRINAVHKEHADLLCKAIKFSTKLMSRLLTTVENYNTSTIELDILMKTKLFLKITRVVIDNAKSAHQNSNGKELELFSM
jgi:hypothetical protein